MINFHPHRLYRVTLHDRNNHLTDSSTKIEHIVRTIMELKESEPNVKIVIFSQWSDMLVYLERSLISTKISYRNKVDKFYQTIREFKVRNSNNFFFFSLFQKAFFMFYSQF